MLPLVITCCNLSPSITICDYTMANIEKRISKDGKISYRVKVRLKGALLNKQHSNGLLMLDDGHSKQSPRSAKADNSKQPNQKNEHSMKWLIVISKINGTTLSFGML